MSSISFPEKVESEINDLSKYKQEFWNDNENIFLWIMRR